MENILQAIPSTQPFLHRIMYDQENNESPASSDESSQPGTPLDSAGPAPIAKRPADAIMLQCPYCRKEFERSTTKSMPFCSSRCKQIDLGLWLNEVHGMPYDIDPGVS